MRTVGLLQVWDWGGNGFIRFRAEDCSRQSMGAVVENAVLQGALLDRVSKSAEVELMFPVRLQAVF